jgi:hypothetical protein
MTTPDDVVKYARSWLGTKWVHQGRTERGIDCAGLLMRTIWEFGLEGEDLKGYRRDPGPAFLQQIRLYTDPVRPVVPVNGAIGIFNDTTMPCHTGIFAVDSDTGAVTVIHSEAFPKRRVHEQYYSEGSQSLESRLVDIRLFRGVDYV